MPNGRMVETGDKILDDLYARLNGVRRKINWRERRMVNGRYPTQPEEELILNQIRAREMEFDLHFAQQEVVQQQQAQSP